MINLNNGLEVLTATIWGEARGESLLGQQGVAATVLNRAAYAKAHHRPQFGNGTICSACLAPWQYSSWNKNDANYPKIITLDITNPAVSQVLGVAQSAIAGTLIDPTKGATFYKVTTLPWPSEWGVEVPALCVIGKHSFYNLITEEPPYDA